MYPFDLISDHYRRDEMPTANQEDNEATYLSWIEEFGSVLDPGARVLDLGSGAGIRATKLLADAGFTVTGVDISQVQIDRARSLVPNAEFVHADMAVWKRVPANFDGIVSLYSMIHLPLGDQRNLIPRLAEWLTPSGYLLAIVGHQPWIGVEDYFGAPMFWEHADTMSYLSWFTDVGLIPLWDRFIPEGNSGHTLLLARKH